MSKLRPTLWRTCRVLSNETRLRLLWEIFRGPTACVAELAARVGTTEHNASTQLRALSARGLITAHRKKNKVFYMPEANTEVEHAQELLNILKNCFEYGMSFKTVIQQTTAFTHQRRIALVQIIEPSGQSFDELLKASQMSFASLARHLRKLKSRGFIEKKTGIYRLVKPANPLGRTLLKIAKPDTTVSAP